MLDYICRRRVMSAHREAAVLSFPNLESRLSLPNIQSTSDISDTTMTASGIGCVAKE